PLGEELLPGLLRPDQLAEQRDAQRRLRVLVAEQVELAVGALEVAGEAGQLAQEAAAALVGRGRLDLLEAGGQGVVQPPRFEAFFRVHGRRPFSLESGVRSQGPEMSLLTPDS